jgi:hypothetical protein
MSCISLSNGKICKNIPRIFTSFCDEHYFVVKKYKEYKLLEKQNEFVIESNLCYNIENLTNVYKSSLQYYAILSKIILLRENFMSKYIHHSFHDYGHLFAIKILKDKLQHFDKFLVLILKYLKISKKETRSVTLQRSVSEGGLRPAQRSKGAYPKESASETRSVSEGGNEVVFDTRFSASEGKETNNLKMNVVTISSVLDANGDKLIFGKREAYPKEKKIKNDNYHDKLYELINNVFDPVFQDLNPKYYIEKLNELNDFVNELPDKIQLKHKTYKLGLNSKIANAYKKQLENENVYKNVLTNSCDNLELLNNIITQEYDLEDQMIDIENQCVANTMCVSLKLISEQFDKLQLRISLLSQYRKKAVTEHCFPMDRINQYIKKISKDIMWWSKHLKKLKYMVNNSFIERNED